MKKSIITLSLMSILIVGCVPDQRSKENVFNETFKNSTKVSTQIKEISLQNEIIYQKELIRKEEERKRLEEEKRQKEEQERLERERLEKERKEKEEQERRAKEKARQQAVHKQKASPPQPKPTSKPQPAPKQIGNAFQREFLGYLNQERARKGLNPVQLDEELNWGAKVRSDELAPLNDIRVNGKPHYRPNGTYFRTVLPHRRIGENTAGSWEVQRQKEGHSYAYHAFDAWCSSPGHYKLMMTPHFKYIGVSWSPSERMRSDNEYQVDWSGLVFVLLIE